MTMTDKPTPENCPTPVYHETHYYCPSCSFVAEDAPVSEAEAQRGRADLLHAELGEALAENQRLRKENKRLTAILNRSGHNYTIEQLQALRDQQEQSDG